MLENFPIINTILSIFLWFIFSGWAVALTGSGNMDQRFLDLNFEITMMFYDQQVVQAFHAEEARYMERSNQLTLAAWQQRSAKDKFLQNSAKLVGPLL